MKRHFRKKRNRRARIGKGSHRLSRRRSERSAILRVAAALGAVIGIAFIALALVFLLETVFKVKTPLNISSVFVKKTEEPDSVTAQPQTTPEVLASPTPAPHPMESFDPASSWQRIVMKGEHGFSSLADPYCFNDSIICSIGRTVNGNVRYNGLVLYDAASSNVTELNIEPVCGELIFPVFNDKWIVYFDANESEGGGEIRYVSRLSAEASPKTIKKVYVGQPHICLDGDRIAWIERTGSEREKIFVCDLNSEETVVADYFDNKSSGTSMPELSHGRLVWASSASMTDAESIVKYYDLAAGGAGQFRPGYYVHDPEFNGTLYAWLDSPHANATKLYVSDGATGSKEIAQSVITYGLDDEFIAYSKNNAVFMYHFETEKTYRLTAENENAQLLSVSGGMIIWSDVTARERELIKFVMPPRGSN